jgi:hypothetical protein
MRYCLGKHPNSWTKSSILLELTPLPSTCFALIEMFSLFKSLFPIALQKFDRHELYTRTKGMQEKRG